MVCWPRRSVSPVHLCHRPRFGPEGSPQVAFLASVGEDNAKAAAGADLVLLAVKPQVLPAVLQDVTSLRETRGFGAAGVTTAWIQERVSAARHCAAMPNTPALVREGVTALAYAADLAADDVAAVRAYSKRWALWSRSRNG